MEGSVAAREASPSRLGATRAWMRERRVWLMIGGPVLIVLLAVGYLLLNQGVVRTDDATVQLARVAISPSVRGRIIEITVHENQRVRRGEVLLRIDPDTYQAAVVRAQARLAAARLQVTALHAQYDQSSAELRAATDSLAFAQREATRQRNLFRAGVASRQQLDEAVHRADLAGREAAAARSAQATALANLGGLTRADTAHPAIAQAQAELDSAQSDLESTTVAAPDDGIVTRVNQIQLGSYAQSAQPLFWLLSGRPWVDAAFKENQLTHLRPGQHAEIRIDAFPNRIFPAHVESFSPGTGSSFSLIPPENATGNWVKVVQRLNVRLAFDSLPTDLPVAAGLSAAVAVDTKSSAEPALRGTSQ